MFNAKLYCITCFRNDLSYEEQVEQACLGGADAVEFIEKTLSAKEFLFTGAKLKEICDKRGVSFMVNDRPDLAVALDADGVHLGAEDIPIKWARKILGPGKIIGLSVSSLGQAVSAAQDGADYVAVGPIYLDELKPGKQLHDVDIIRLIRKRIKLPIIAAGGINVENVREVIEAGADGVAAARSVCGAGSVQKSAQEMKEKIQSLLLLNNKR